jgi:hypothetical protein
MTKGLLGWHHRLPRHARPRHGTVFFVASKTAAAAWWRATLWRGDMWPENKHPLSSDLGWNGSVATGKSDMLTINAWILDMVKFKKFVCTL